MGEFNGTACMSSAINTATHCRSALKVFIYKLFHSNGATSVVDSKAGP